MGDQKPPAKHEESSEEETDSEASSSSYETDSDAEEVTDSSVVDIPVLQWYDRKRPLFIDLVGDYAGKEIFLIEGDSLLRYCFEDERIDFAGKLSMSSKPFRFAGVTFRPKPQSMISLVKQVVSAQAISMSSQNSMV